MSSVLARLASAFVAPADATPGAAHTVGAQAAAPSAARVALLCRPADAQAVGGAVALGLLRAGGPGPAVLCVWRPDAEARGPHASAPSLPGALRLAERLSARGHATRATGRIVVADVDAAAEAVRVAAAAADAPVVCALAGARDTEADDLLAAQDAVLVAAAADDPPALLDLALSGLAAAGVPALGLPVPAGAAPARALAAAGVALLAPLRGAVEAALEAW